MLVPTHEHAPSQRGASMFRQVHPTCYHHVSNQKADPTWLSSFQTVPTGELVLTANFCRTDGLLDHAAPLKLLAPEEMRETEGWEGTKP